MEGRWNWLRTTSSGGVRWNWLRITSSGGVRWNWLRITSSGGVRWNWLRITSSGGVRWNWLRITSSGRVRYYTDTRELPLHTVRTLTRYMKLHVMSPVVLRPRWLLLACHLLFTWRNNHLSLSGVESCQLHECVLLHSISRSLITVMKRHQTAQRHTSYWLTFCSTLVTICTTCCNITEFYILLAQPISVFVRFS
jgi:hypothetical protein